jgi:predicted porin
MRRALRSIERSFTAAVMFAVTVSLVPAASAQTLPAEEEAPASMFEKGTRTFELHGGMYDEIFESDEDLGIGAIGAGYYFADRHCFRVELTGWDLNAKGGNPDTTAVGGNLGLRFHFLEYERFTLFAEGVLGFYYADRKFPPGGTHFNFTQQGGLGATYRLHDNVHLYGAARYVHASNARIHGDDENPSVDALGGYVGVLFTF